MDELSVDARDKREEYREDVGYLSGTSSPGVSLGILITGSYMTVRRPRRLFSISPVRLFGVSCPVERQAPGDGFPGS
jgi:hypothetical protein